MFLFVLIVIFAVRVVCDLQIEYGMFNDFSVRCIREEGAS